MVRFEFAAAALMLSAPALTARADETKMTVQVKTAQVRETPSFLGKLVGSLTYGNIVIVLEKPGDWIKVRSEQPPMTGWMHKSSLTTRPIAVKSGANAANVSASPEELALAGRGFDDEIEKAFRAKHADLAAAFTQVDAMEHSFPVTPQQIAAFLAAGGVKPMEGKGR